VTLEANPEHISYELMHDFKRAGINRVSIGIQSFSDPLLHQIGRTHSSGKGQEAILVTKEAGIDNITIDLMYDLPHQHLKDWEMTLDRLSSLPITHLSLYNLVIEPDSAYHRKKKQLTAAMPHPEVSSKMLEVAIERFEALGLLRYEISAFAREGYRSKHNVGYWTGRPFLGLGPSAFSYFNGERFSNVANLTFYTQKLSQNQSAITFRERLPYPDDVHELLAVELRLIEGVDIPSFEKRHALLPPDTKKTIDRLISEGFLEREGARIRLSTKGLLFYDTVASEII
jgi:oxygen-independent coproporphyrinogen-3 oxidase